MKNSITAIVHGEYQYPTMPKPKQFTEKVTFTMIPPDDDVHYGTGYYMSVTGFANGYDQLIDVRYEGTTDVEKLARRFIENYWGSNLHEYTFE